MQKNVQSLMQFILNPFLKVRVNDEQKYIMLLCKFHSYNCDFSSWMLLIRFNFQNTDKNQNSGEPYYSPQSDQTNSDDTISRDRNRSYSLKKVFLKILQNSQERTFVGVSFFTMLEPWGLQINWKRDSDAVVFLWI